jgi:two-component system sensor histidine kinase YesM
MINGLKKKWNISIQLKITIAFLTVNLASLLLVSLISHITFEDEIKKDFNNVSKEVAARLNNHMEFYFLQMEQSAASLIRAQAIQDFLSSNRVYSKNESQQVENELEKYISNGYPEIIGVFVMSKNNQVLSSFGGYLSNEGSFSNEPWYHISDTETKVIDTHKTNYPQYKTSVLSMVIPVYSVESVDMIGRLVIDFSLTQIDQIFEKAQLGKSGYFYIISPDQRMIYHPNLQWLGLPLNNTDLSELYINHDEGYAVLQRWRNESWLVSSKQSNISGWSIVSLVPFDEMNSRLITVRNTTLISFTLVSFCIILIVPFLSTRFVKPILQLKNLMQHVARGNFKARAEIRETADEFQYLNLSFNRMVGQLNDLMDRVYASRLKELHLNQLQKEATIRTLQNQINPHLLYNSLDLIASFAYLEDAPKIEKMAKNLAEVYRYSAKFADNEVTLQHEIDQLLKYMHIMEIRFPHQFQNRIIIHEKFLNCLCIKLTLQPIVENAVKYAIEPNGGKGTLMINSYDENDDLLIEVADNGPGIPQHILEDIERKCT